QTPGLPLIAPGPHIVSTFVPGRDNHGNLLNPPTGDDLVLNQAVTFIDVTFDRDMDPNSFITGHGATQQLPADTTLFQLLGPAGVIPLFVPASARSTGLPNATAGQPLPGVSISPDPPPDYPRLIDGVITTDPDPNLNAPRTYRITLPTQPVNPVTTTLAAAVTTTI